MSDEEFADVRREFLMADEDFRWETRISRMPDK
jgi:hypothetical protein